MTANHIHNAMRAVPFKPFNVYTSNGRVFSIPHPEFIETDPNGRSAIVARPDGYLSVLDIHEITEVEIVPQPDNLAENGYVG